MRAWEIGIGYGLGMAFVASINCMEMFIVFFGKCSMEIGEYANCVGVGAGFIDYYYRRWEIDSGKLHIEIIGGRLKSNTHIIHARGSVSSIFYFVHPKSARIKIKTRLLENIVFSVNTKENNNIKPSAAHLQSACFLPGKSDHCGNKHIKMTALWIMHREMPEFQISL